MAMNGDVLAQEILTAMGGEVTKERDEAFRKLCRALVTHIQTYGIVIGTATGVTTGGAAVPVTGKLT
jgi:hypothetical protein